VPGPDQTRLSPSVDGSWVVEASRGTRTGARRHHRDRDPGGASGGRDVHRGRTGRTRTASRRSPRPDHTRPDTCSNNFFLDCAGSRRSGRCSRADQRWSATAAGYDVPITANTALHNRTARSAVMRPRNRRIRRPCCLIRIPGRVSRPRIYAPSRHSAHFGQPRGLLRLSRVFSVEIHGVTTRGSPPGPSSRPFCPGFPRGPILAVESSQLASTWQAHATHLLTHAPRTPRKTRTNSADRPANAEIRCYGALVDRNRRLFFRPAPNFRAKPDVALWHTPSRLRRRN
jgi:hypothetical protein